MIEGLGQEGAAVVAVSPGKKDGVLIAEEIQGQGQARSKIGVIGEIIVGYAQTGEQFDPFPGNGVLQVSGMLIDLGTAFGTVVNCSSAQILLSGDARRILGGTLHPGIDHRQVVEIIPLGTPVVLPGTGKSGPQFDLMMGRAEPQRAHCKIHFDVQLLLFGGQGAQASGKAA